MKKEYVKPFIEKIEFDYTIQTAGSICYESVANIKVGTDECGEGMKISLGWDNDAHF